MYDDVTRRATLKQVQQFHTHSTVVASLAQRLAALGEVIMGEPCSLQNVQYFNKPPTSVYAEGGSSRPTPPHQDGFYWMHELGATMWCAC